MPKDRQRGNSKGGYKGWKDRKWIGKASSGHGFALDRKSKMVAKFKKRYKNKRKEVETELHVTPVAYDPLRDNSVEVTQQDNSSGKEKIAKVDVKRKRNKLQTAQILFQRQQGENIRLKLEREASIVEHTKKVNKDIQKRKKTAQKLMQKNKRGQPVLANQIGYLLDKIKGS